LYWRVAPGTVGRMRRSRFYADLRFRLWVFWHGTDKGAWAFALIIGGILAGFGFALHAVFSYKDEKLDELRALHARNIDCLARNIYHEARGEPTVGQYAVAEVTMNRRASGLYPRTVCEVVYQQNWDPIRGRYVGAFSWTEFDSLPPPRGAHWRQARAIAEAVYAGKRVPEVQGALFYHANYIRPDWAKDKKVIARIGRHVFYR
jgi:N-acetylmuramoyl-L-alanine amidase